MGSVSFVSARRRSPIVQPRIKDRYRRQSPLGAQRSRSVSEDDEEYRMGLRKSYPGGPYDTIDNLPTAGIALYLRFRANENCHGDALEQRDVEVGWLDNETSELGRDATKVNTIIKVGTAMAVVFVPASFIASLDASLA